MGQPHCGKIAVFQYEKRTYHDVYFVVKIMDVLSSRKNPLVTHIKKLSANKGYRRQCGEFFCEGQKLLAEALESGAVLSSVIFSGDQPMLPQGVRAVKASEDIIASISQMKSPPQVVFVCKIPDLQRPLVSGKHMVLENMQDPGNIGTIIRTANAFDFASVVLLGACADPYSPKAVRASMGAVFRQTILEMGQSDLIGSLDKLGIPLYCAALTENATDLRQTILTNNVAIAVGNEGQGLSPELLNAKGQAIMIPMMPNTESLNAAAAATVLMWEIFRQSYQL